jgi:AcrR family transcriptional regulator
MQRRRVLAAAEEAIADVGWSGLTVEEIIQRARVSRRTFYEIFDGCEDCFLRTFEVAMSEATALAEDAYLRQGGWRDGIRAALTRMLVFFDEEPARARLLLVESATAGETVLARRTEALRELAGVIDGGRRVKGDAPWPSFPIAEGVIGGVMSVLQTRMQEPRRRPLVDLTAQLMSFIVLPYLGAAAAQRELERPVSSARRVTPKRETLHRKDPLAGLNMRLTYRTVQVLRSIRRSPGASNHALADACGILDQGQISKLVARLERLGLVENRGEGHARGGANAWFLTARGTQLERATQAY